MGNRGAPLENPTAGKPSEKIRKSSKHEGDERGTMFKLTIRKTIRKHIGNPRDYYSHNYEAVPLVPFKAALKGNYGNQN